jgi:hypothetical protein
MQGCGQAAGTCGSPFRSITFGERFEVLLSIVLHFPQSAFLLLRQTHNRSHHSRQERPNLPQRRTPKNVFVCAGLLVLLQMQAILCRPMAKNRSLKAFCRSLMEILLRISAMGEMPAGRPGMTMVMTV